MPSRAGSNPSYTSDHAKAAPLRPDLRQVGHHDIGAGLAQRLRLPAVIDADDTAESAGASRLDAGDRVLDDDRARRFHLEALRRLQERIGRRLAVESQAGDIHPVHPRVEQLRYTGGLEHRRAVVAGGHDRSLDLLRPQRAHERDRRFIDLDAVLLQVLQ